MRCAHTHTYTHTQRYTLWIILQAPYFSRAHAYTHLYRELHRVVEKHQATLVTLHCHCHACTHTHTHTHTHTETHTHTHTHTHASALCTQTVPPLHISPYSNLSVSVKTC